MNFMAQIWSCLVHVMQFELFNLEGNSITVLSIIELITLSVLLIVYAPKLNSVFLKKYYPRAIFSPELRRMTIRIGRFLIMAAGFLIIFHVVGIDTWVLKILHKIYEFIQAIVDLKLFKLGNTQLTLLTVIYVLVASFVLVRGTGKFRTAIVDKYLAKTRMDIGIRQTVATVIQYSVLFLGFVILLQTAGIDLSAMTVMMGALGIGISFGLQQIMQNLISGLIILFERPIKIGDRVQIGDITGEVIKISLRATTIMTSDAIVIHVPNSQFITSNVINWTYSGKAVGLRISIAIPNDSGLTPEEAQEFLLAEAKTNSKVMSDPPPAVMFEEYSKDSMKFTVRYWTRDLVELPPALRNQLNYALAHRLQELKEKQQRAAEEKEEAQNEAAAQRAALPETGAQNSSPPVLPPPPESASKQ